MTADGNGDADEDEDGNQDEDGNLDAGACGDEDDSGDDASRQHVAPGGDAYVAGRDLYVNVHQGAATTPTAGTAVLGRPLAECNPYKLEVHRAIDAPGAPGELPLYVRRAHDDQVDQAVRAAAGGRSRLVVLVGGSSTGKTRCCWEAVRAELLRDGWRLFHPISPSYPEALGQALGSIGRRTVIWLNDMQNFELDSTAGTRIVAGLRELLDDTERAPVLVIGTLWNQNWNSLSGQPEPGAPDPLKQLREMLNGGTTVFVPPAFGPADLTRAKALAERDPRLREALRLAQRGEITQFLAGAPDLLKRYHAAPVHAGALIDAALGARRLGHAPALPLALLAAAVPGYLRDHEARELAEDAGWLDRAIDYATRRPHDASGALTQVDADWPGPHYRLADYLEQSLPGGEPPASLLDALAAHAGLTDVTALGERVEQRGYYRYALALYRAAESRGDPRASLRLAWLHDRMGQQAEALDASRRAVQAKASESAFESYGLGLAAAGRIDESLAAYQQAAELGSRFAANQVVELLQRSGGPEAAIRWLLPRSEAHDGPAQAHALERLMALYERAGETDQALSAAKRLAGLGGTEPIEQAVGLLVRTGLLQVELPWLQSFAETHPHAPVVKEAVLRALQNQGQAIDLEWARPPAPQADDYRGMTELIERNRGAGAAIDWLRRRLDPESPDDLEILGSLLWRADQPEEAVAAFSRAARAGSTDGARRAAWTLADTGRRAEAIRWLESCLTGAVSARLSRGDIRFELACLLELDGRPDDALALFKSAALEDEIGIAVDGAARLFAIRGEIEEALALARQADPAYGGEVFGVVFRVLWEQGETDAAIALARRAHAEGYYLSMQDLPRDAFFTEESLDPAGNVEETLAQLLALADAGVLLAQYDAALLLRFHGREAEAERLERFGLEPGGSIADVPSAG